MLWKLYNYTMPGAVWTLLCCPLCLVFVLSLSPPIICVVFPSLHAVCCGGFFLWVADFNLMEFNYSIITQFPFNIIINLLLKRNELLCYIRWMSQAIWSDTDGIIMCNYCRHISLYQAGHAINHPTIMPPPLVDITWGDIWICLGR